MSKVRFWCYTCNTCSAAGHLANPDALDANITYVCEQKEKASTGQLHMQGYLQLKKGQRLSWVRSHYCTHAHWEPSKGTATQARDYCQKEDTQESPPVEYGNFREPSPGKRNDVLALRDAFRDNKRSVEDIYEDDALLPTLAKYPRFGERMAARYMAKLSEMTKLWIFKGPPGTGKSYAAYTHDPNAYYKDVTSNWYDGYTGQDTVIMDDFNGQISLNMMLRLIDRYPMRVQVKGAYVQWRPKLVIITTNSDYTSWWNTDQKNYAKQLPAFERRITEERSYLIKYREVHTDSDTESGQDTDPDEYE